MLQGYGRQLAEAEKTDEDTVWFGSQAPDAGRISAVAAAVFVVVACFSVAAWWACRRRRRSNCKEEEGCKSPTGSSRGIVPVPAGLSPKQVLGDPKECVEDVQSSQDIPFFSDAAAAKAEPATEPSPTPTTPLREGRFRRPRAGDVVKVVQTLSVNNRHTVGMVGTIAEDYQGEFPYKIDGIDQWRYAEAEVELAQAQAFEHVLSEAEESEDETCPGEHNSDSDDLKETVGNAALKRPTGSPEVDDACESFRRPSKRGEALQKYQKDMDGDWSVFDLFCNCNGSDCTGAGGRRVSDITVAPAVAAPPAVPATASFGGSALRESPAKAGRWTAPVMQGVGEAPTAPSDVM